MSQGMNYDPSNPLIVQGDRTVLVEVDNPQYAEARDALAPFAELEKSPEHIHTYRLTNLSLWNAAAPGMTAEDMIDVLQKYSKFPLPINLLGRDRRARQPLRRSQAACMNGHEDKLKLVCVDQAAAGGTGPAAQGARLSAANGSTPEAFSSSRPIAASSSRH